MGAPGGTDAPPGDYGDLDLQEGGLVVARPGTECGASGVGVDALPRGGGLSVPGEEGMPGCTAIDEEDVPVKDGGLSWSCDRLLWTARPLAAH